MICIYHNNDLDGLTSGAIVKRKFPDCKLIGWDYGNPIVQVPDSEEVIMIDVTFPIEDMKNLGIGRQLTVIDHHVSFKKEYDERVDVWDKFLYIYKAGIAACEIAWKYYFPDEKLPKAVELLSKYDTWRENGTKEWDEEILPFQYYMRLETPNVEKYPTYFLENGKDEHGFDLRGDMYVEEAIADGALLVKYQQVQNGKLMEKFSFERTFKGLKAICVNQAFSSSITFQDKWDESKYDLMMPFVYNGEFYKWSLYTTKKDIDCSALAKEMGGGGHRMAAGFETKIFEETFKNQEVLS